MKIYTKTGDKGSTSLFGGRRLDKDDLRIEAYGTVDELNAFVGSLHDQCSNEMVKQYLFTIQNKLFNIGSILACDPESNFKMDGINKSDITYLEMAIDSMNDQLLPLKNFILPSGHINISSSHVCRTVCRRAERRLVSLQKESPIDSNIMIYLNRLSDFFFILARYLAAQLNVEDIIWKP